MKCELCQIWADTKRPCTASLNGECDCPVCFGICCCDVLCGSEEDDENTYRARIAEAPQHNRRFGDKR